MILRSVTLTDFGLYSGSAEFDLMPRRGEDGTRSVILIGGKNGAGKTTFLEAVRLSLYGKRALGVRVGQSQYEDYLRGRINASALDRRASVALEFDYAEAGAVHRYRVKREWSERGKSLIETLALEKDGSAMTSVPRDEWHHFLQELIPPGVSQLFFFDGEKISEIAEGEQDNEQLADAIRSLLGMELVERLRLDLGLYLARHQRGDGDQFAKRLDEVNRDIDAAQDKVAELSEVVADLFTQRESQARSAERVRRQFVSEGGDAALQRAKIEAGRDEVRRAILRAEHELRDMANKLLPFALAPKMVLKFKQALERSGGTESQLSVFIALREAFEAWRESDKPSRNGNWQTDHWKDIGKFFDSALPPKATGSLSPALQEVGDGNAALARLNEIDLHIRPRALALKDEMDKLAQQERDLMDALTRADNAAAGVLLDELRIAEQSVGATEVRLKSSQDELQLVRGQLVTLSREQKRLLDDQAAAAKGEERAELASRTAEALADYEKRLLDHKLSQLRTEFVHCFNRLARKGGLIQDVRIDLISFEAVLVGKNNREIPKAALSAGEKQIYAIAMLWALARTSGRQLPMIVDTPLARLDSEHRAKLVETYFPEASHQVILLSTDTEIDEPLRAELAHSVSHSFLLNYDHQLGQTSVSMGYFGEEAIPEGEPRALQQA
ncbi:DNA sulfur modification protein DndD [Nostoc sp. CHAB 5715]|nr:DNA sulfur modification protein DndD [Nostoc sp. CHAB 5715]